MAINKASLHRPSNTYRPFSEHSLLRRIEIVLITFWVSLFTLGFASRITYNALRDRVTPLNAPQKNASSEALEPAQLPSVDRTDPLYQAVIRENLPAIYEIIDKNRDLVGVGIVAIALQHGKSKALEALLKKWYSYEPAHDVLVPLAQKSESKQVFFDWMQACMCYPLELKVPISVQRFAKEMGNERIAAFPLRPSVELDMNHLHRAARVGDLITLRWVLSRGVPVSAKIGGRTVYNIAIENQQLRVARCLAQKKSK